MQIFDTHCHYNLEPLYSGKQGYFSQKQIININNQNWQFHWQNAKKKGAVAALISGYDLNSSKRAIEISEKDPNLFASVGLHPIDGLSISSQQLEKDFAQITKLVNNKQVKAIGETGLDYFHLSPKDYLINSELQKKLFIQHIQLANKYKKPLIIHVRDQKFKAHQDVANIMKTNYQFLKPFVLHCVSGPASYLKKMVKLGAYISFAGNITYNSAQDLRDLVKLVPQDKLLIETDAPFLPPQKYRGQINQPYMIKETALFMKKEFKINLNQILNNSYQFFDIKNT